MPKKEKSTEKGPNDGEAKAKDGATEVKNAASKDKKSVGKNKRPRGGKDGGEKQVKKAKKEDGKSAASSSKSHKKATTSSHHDDDNDDNDNDDNDDNDNHDFAHVHLIDYSRAFNDKALDHKEKLFQSWIEKHGDCDEVAHALTASKNFTVHRHSVRFVHVCSLMNGTVLCLNL